jgi:hypothetical protein
MNKTLRTVIMVTAPLASLMTLALGLRIGAEAGVHAAMVSVTPKSGKTTRGYVRVVAYYDESNVKETVALDDLAVVVRVRGAETKWSGATNPDGIVDIPVELPGDLREDEAIDVTVRRTTEPYPLANGRVSAALFFPDKSAEAPRVRAVRPTKREGAIALDLTIPDVRLSPEVPTRAFVKMRIDGTAPKAPRVTLAPEGGIESSLVRTCPDGVAELALVASFSITGIGVTVKDGDAGSGGEKTGEWFGALPVAMGAPRVHLPTSEPAGKPFDVDVVASNARSGVYVVVDDAEGRAFSDFQPIRVTQSGAQKATFHVPALPEGLYFMTASGDPKAIDALDSSAVAHPFVVRKEPPDACALYDALLPQMQPTKRTDVLDGLYVRRQGDRAKKRRGLFLALFSLAVAAVLEIVLLVSASRDARADLASQMKDLLDEEDAKAIDLDAKESKGVPRLLVAVLIALLGFTLIGAFVVWRV